MLHATLTSGVQSAVSPGAYYFTTLGLQKGPSHFNPLQARSILAIPALTLILKVHTSIRRSHVARPWGRERGVGGK